jgi:hypothetical protein
MKLSYPSLPKYGGIVASLSPAAVHESGDLAASSGQVPWHEEDCGGVSYTAL